MNIAELLDKAEGAPLGPLTLKATSDGQDAWWLSLTLAGAPPVSVRMIHDIPNSAVRLERQIHSQTPLDRWQGALDSRSWIVDLAPIAGGGVSVRLYLSDLDLQLNTLLMAASDLARLEKLANPSAAKPAATPRTVSSWQTMGTQAASAPAPAAAPQAAPPSTPTPNGAGNYCKECGTLRPPNHTFCTNCGASMT
jgi:hypothetical protein